MTRPALHRHDLVRPGVARRLAPPVSTRRAPSDMPGSAPPIAHRPRARRAGPFLATLALALAAASPQAAELVVRVTGLSAPLSQVGCSLFASDVGFPMDNAGARVQWLAADAQGVLCRFSGVSPGTYAVAVGHDLNGNRRVDTNFVGLPTEPWGVSNNVRPRLRAPRFEEATLQIPADIAEVVIDVRVAK